MNWWRKFLKWNAEADENNFAYNFLHIIFWAVAFGTFLFLLTKFG